MEPALIEKFLRFWGELSRSEVWYIVLGVPAAITPFLAVVWNWAHSKGETRERTQGPLKLKVDDLRHENGKLTTRIDLLTQNLRVREEDSEARRGDIDLPADVRDILAIRQALISSSLVDIWMLRQAKPPEHLCARLRASKTKIVTVANLKGGVGKTTLVSNLAAYFDLTRSKRVLTIDLDYQGSLSATMLQAAEKRLENSLADTLLSGSVNGQWLCDVAKDLSPILPNTDIVPASYTLASAEEQLMMRWLFYATDRDVRFNLAEVLLSEEIQKRYDIIIMDVGPRLTTASISALCASTHLLVPTNLDRLSAETIGSFMTRLSQLKQHLGLAVELAGVVGTMTYQSNVTDDEKEAISTIKDGLQRWNGDGHIFTRNIPRKKKLADVAGSDIGFVRDGEIRTIFSSLGAEVAERIAL